MSDVTDIIRRDGVQKITGFFGDVANLKSLDYQVLGESVAMIQSMAGLRAAYLMSSVDENGDVYDLSGQGRTLTNNNAATFGVNGLQSYTSLDGISQYLSRPNEAGVNITGAVTLGCWVRFGSITTTQIVIGRNDAGTNNRSFRIAFSNLGYPQFFISSTGVDVISCLDVNILPALNAWTFLVARYIPSTEMKMWANNQTAINTAGIPAAMFSAVADFNIGATHTGTNLLTGNVANGFLCAAALSDEYIQAYYNISRNLFGV